MSELATTAPAVKSNYDIHLPMPEAFRRLDADSNADSNAGGAFHQELFRTAEAGTGSRLSKPGAGSSQTLDLPDLKLFDSLIPAVAADWQVPFGAHSKDKKTGVNLEPIDKPPGMPDVHNHPASTKFDGKCGITGVCNMLRLYGVEKDPGKEDTYESHSWGPGMTIDKFAENLSRLSGKTFKSGSVDGDSNAALDVLKNNLKDGKPVAICYQCEGKTAHWVVVTGINEGKDGPELTVQSWGQYHKVKWDAIKDHWKQGYGLPILSGNYPYVVGDEAAPALKK